MGAQKLWAGGGFGQGGLGLGRGAGLGWGRGAAQKLWARVDIGAWPRDGMGPRRNEVLNTRFL